MLDDHRNGIDIPSANTIIINRADKFAGSTASAERRVGRSSPAYAYLFLPPQVRPESGRAEENEAIQAATNLGAGFTLASHDLEIRGAGELGEAKWSHAENRLRTLF